MREILNVGTMIGGADTAKNNGIIEKYCYNDTLENCDMYGGLYARYEAAQYIQAEARGICPEGWHMPVHSEFQALSTFVGGDGNSLKAIGQGVSDGTGTNRSGFSALLACYRRLM